MRSIARKWTGITITTVFCCLALSCNRTGDLTTRFSGEWKASASTSQDDCNLGAAVGPLAGQIRIAQSGRDLVMDLVGCCLSETIGTGTAEWTSFTMTSTRTVTVSEGCTYQLDEIDSGTLDGDRLRADASVRVTCPGTCPTSLWCASMGPTPASCEIRGQVDATRCGEMTGCGVVCLGIICVM